MISGSAAYTSSLSTRTGLTYVNDVITGATAQGLFHVFIEESYLDTSMTGSLKSYGYKVTPQTFGGTYTRFLIDWSI